MQTARLIFLALILCGSLAAVETREKGADMSDNPEANADSLLAEADGSFQAREYQTALEQYARVIEVARADFNRPVETEALAQVARVNLIQGDKEEGRKFLGEAAQRASDSDPMGWSRYLGVRGRFEWQDDDLVKARATFDTMYVYCNTNGLWGRVVDAANMMAIVAEKVEEQIEWSKRGIEAAESGGVESWLGPLWNNLGATYSDTKQFDSALSAFLKAREYHWQFSGEAAKLYADYHVGMTYRHLGQFDKAAQWLRPVLAWAERLEDHSAIGQACEDLGEVAIGTGNREKGLALLKKARDEYKKAGFDQSWKEVWSNINSRIDQLEQKQ
jgi:tetratricopeptide (TPR) repeat protein